MSEQIEKSVLGSVRLDSDVWAAVRALPESLNQYLRRTLLTNGVPKKASKQERAIRERAAGDLVAKAAEREDIDYSDVESTPTTHVATLDAVAPAGPIGKISVENWRANRKPLLKPKERKEQK